MQSLLLVPIYITLFFQFFFPGDLKDTNREGEVDKKVKNGNVVMLIYSYECGYCALNVELYNTLKDSIAKKTSNVKFYVLLESSYHEAKKRYPSQLNNSDSLKWEILDAKKGLHKGYSKENVFPELYFYKNGEIVKEVIGGIYENEIHELSQSFQ